MKRFIFFTLFQGKNAILLKKYKTKGEITMLCRDEAEVMDKLCSLGEEFNERYRRKEYARAMFAYHTAFLVSVFMEIETDTINFLFGTANTEETDEKGLFHREKVRKAHLECIKQGRELPYVDADDMLRILKCIKEPG